MARQRGIDTATQGEQPVTGTIDEREITPFPRAGDHLTPTSVLEVLERFGLAMQQCDQSHEQVRLALDAVRDSLGADAVIWHPGTAGEGFEAATGSKCRPAGDPVARLSAEWARDFLRHLLAEPGTGDRLIRHFLDPGAK